MYLKSLKVTGFKSFADRTRLELEHGVTVVVGPNGSGKSNIVDALAWVMGTQSPTVMRTQKMEDVIFAGTTTRPALGRAEVSLVFDNTDRQLPLDLAEVAVTRRLYRDGSSDYEINGVGCRLLDVQELLADSGMGRQQHVLVGQGQITSILTAKPEDHRAVIEEAAGILKHRLRKERSVRRLERTDADLVRLQDLVHELRRQIRPLKRQAQNAARHDAVRAELQSLLLWMGGEQLRTLDGRLAAITSEETKLTGRIAEAEAERARLEPTIAPIRTDLADLDRQLEETAEAAARLEATAERIRGTTHLAQERRRSLAARLEGADERREDLVQEAEGLKESLDSLAGEERDAEAAALRAESDLLTLEDQERALAEQEGMPAEGASAMVRGELRSQESAAERDRRELSQLDDHVGRLIARREARAVEVAALEQTAASHREMVAARRKALDECTMQEQEADHGWEAAEHARRQADARVASLASRREALEAVVAGGADPRARSRAKRAGGDLGSVTEVLDVPATLASAVDAALGVWQDAEVFDGDASVATAAGELKSDGLGGLALVFGEPQGSAPARAVAPLWGIDALVDRLGPHAAPAVADRLLGDVVVVEGWDIGWQVVRRHPEVRAVTPEGDLITSTGLRFADPEGATPAMLEAAASELELAEEESLEAAAWERQARESRTGMRTRRRSMETEWRSATHHLEAIQHKLDRLIRSDQETAAELERTTARSRLISEGVSGRDERTGELRRRLAALEGEEAERQQVWEELSARRQEVATARDAARLTRQSKEKDLGALVERRLLLTQRLTAVEREIGLLSQTSFDPDALDRLDGVVEAGRRAHDVLRRHIDELRSRQVDLRNRSTEVRHRFGQAGARVGELSTQIAADKDVLSTIVVERTELVMRREGVCEGLRRDADADEEAALVAPRPATDGETTHAERAASLEADLRRMGPINPLAAAEFTELDQRRAFIEEQLADLDASRAEIRKVIKALDGEVETLFMAAYEKVAASFREHVAIMFPGGKGALRLTDPDSPLSTGVEIEVQPLGKKVSRLSLLSGGEKSMAALAFLFAVFRAEPSPFYVLDEVEAALDDANLRRFLDLIEAFRGTSQLIIVTHQQQTMEAADILYGVTMEPGGSSKVIAKRLEQPQLQPQQSATAG